MCMSEHVFQSYGHISYEPSEAVKPVQKQYIQQFL